MNFVVIMIVKGNEAYYLTKISKAHIILHYPAIITTYIGLLSIFSSRDVHDIKPSIYILKFSISFKIVH